MKRDKALQILVGAALFLVVPAVTGIVLGALENSVRTGLIAFGLCALLEADLIGLFMRCLHEAEKESEEKMRAWREQGLSELDIHRLLLEDRLDEPYRMRTGRSGRSRTLDRIEIRDELRDVKEKLERLNEFDR